MNRGRTLRRRRMHGRWAPTSSPQRCRETRVGELVKSTGAKAGVASPRLVLLRSLLLAAALLVTLAAAGRLAGVPDASGQSTATGATPPPSSGGATTSAFDRQGMWIW